MKGRINSIIPDKFVYFFILVLSTIGVYVINISFLISIWGALLLVLYARSDDEPFWLAFFLVTVDGFMGFLGLYSVTVNFLPGVPAVELAHYYIIISLFKAIRKKNENFIFYKRYLQVLLIYLIFLLIWGIIMGFSGGLLNYLRILKSTLPLVLFFTLPRLFNKFESFNRFFGFVFIILILGFITQLFSLITGVSTASAIKLTEREVAGAENFRYFYNTGATLLGLFGALTYISLDLKSPFKVIYLYIVVICAYGMALVSATRGWILGFTIIIILSVLLSNKRKLKRFAGFLIVFALILVIGLSNLKIKNQLSYSKERFMSLNALEEGDLTAGGSLSRITQRSPKVMKMWAENPIFGWGSSDVAKEYSDGHVGNQNLLLSSGIVGFSLLVSFLFYYCIKLFKVYKSTNAFFYLRNSIPVIIVFLIGWYVIHSTSSQQFAFAGMPLAIITQALFFGFGAFVYSESKRIFYE